MTTDVVTVSGNSYIKKKNELNEEKLTVDSVFGLNRLPRWICGSLAAKKLPYVDQLTVSGLSCDNENIKQRQTHQ